MGKQSEQSYWYGGGPIFGRKIPPASVVTTDKHFAEMHAAIQPEAAWLYLVTAPENVTNVEHERGEIVMRGDAEIVKRFTIGGRRRAQLRVDARNWANRNTGDTTGD